MNVSTDARVDAAFQWHRIRMIENPLIRIGLIVLAVLYILWSIFLSLDINWERMAAGLPRAADMLSRMVPPDFSRWELLIRGILESA